MSVVVGDERIFVSRAIVIATGTKAVTQGISGLDTVDFWTNRGAVAATQVPASLVVVGGGAVGCEFAQVFARFGSEVTLLEGEPHILPREEPEACQLLHDVFARDGINVNAGKVVTMCGTDGGGVAVTTKDGGTLTGERLLLAIGRRVDLAAIGASTIGVDESARAIPVDDHMRVKDAPGVWAVGDVAGGGLTHMALHHARIATADILGQDTPGLSQRAVPRVTFTDPEVGAVGLTEKQAREQGIDVRTGTGQVPSSARGWIHKVGNEGFIKLVEDHSRRVLIGATSVGPVGGEVLSMLTLAVHTETTIPDLRQMIYAYPTFHRAVEDALRDLDS
jgi:pyruvate/2-oxoglutarate dehydrogenase complex dihydrolipoamide dehydrogenase (E3) component